MSTLLSAYIYIYMYALCVCGWSTASAPPSPAHMQWPCSLFSATQRLDGVWAKVLLPLPEIVGDKCNLTSSQCAYIFYAYEHEREATTTEAVIHLQCRMRQAVCVIVLHVAVAPHSRLLCAISRNNGGWQYLTMMHCFAHKCCWLLVVHLNVSPFVSSRLLRYLPNAGATVNDFAHNWRFWLRSVLLCLQSIYLSYNQLSFI